MAEQDTAREKARLELTTEVMAGFAHDLSNPLQTLTVQLELLGPAETIGAARLERSLDSARTVGTLVRGLATVSRLLGDGEEPVEIERVGEGVANLLARRCRRSGIRWEASWGPLAGATVGGNDFAFGVLAICWPLLRRATEAELSGELRLRGTVDPTAAGERVELSLGQVRLAEPDRRRAKRVLQGTPIGFAEQDGGVYSLALPRPGAAP